MSENNLSLAVNEAYRQYSTARQAYLAGSSQINTKYSKFLCEIGVPEIINGDHLRKVYDRNSYAFAAVNAICGKVWEEHPHMVEGDEGEDNAKETETEKEIARFARRTKLWASLYEADKRRAAGEYAALIINIADAEPQESRSQHWGREVGSLRSPDQILGFIPVWQQNITVNERYGDEEPQKYGQPKTYSYVPYDTDTLTNRNTPNNESLNIHESRVILLGDVYGQGDVAIAGNKVIVPGYNQLAMIEMIEGSSTAGITKAAKGALKFLFNKDASLESIAEMYSVPVSELKDKFNEQVEKLNTGIDASFVGQNVDVSGIDINLPDVEVVYEGLKAGFASAVRVPVTVFRGIETGERSSTENSKQFNRDMESRRNNVEKPECEMIFERFQDWGLFGTQPLVCVFPSLLEPTPEDKLDNANTVADIINKLTGVADTAPIVEKLYEMLDVKQAPLSKQEEKIRKEGEKIDEEIDQLPD